MSSKYSQYVESLLTRAFSYLRRRSTEPQTQQPEKEQLGPFRRMTLPLDLVEGKARAEAAGGQPGRELGTEVGPQQPVARLLVLLR